MTVILPSLTTYMTPDWPERVGQLDQLNITQMALFLTDLVLAERKKLYQLLPQTKLKQIPQVHLRDDMETWEIDWLIKNYQTSLFNIHASPEFAQFVQENSQYRHLFYVENGKRLDDLFEKMVTSCAGLCLDFSHWAVGQFLHRPGYQKLPAIVETTRIGCAHVSAFVPQGRVEHAPKRNYVSYAPHDFLSLNELDYLLQFKKYLPEYVSLELVNPLSQHLEAIAYLQKKLQK